MRSRGLQALAKTENTIVWAALALLTLLAWIALLAGAATGMDPVAMSSWRIPMAMPRAKADRGASTIG